MNERTVRKLSPRAVTLVLAGLLLAPFLVILLGRVPGTPNSYVCGPSGAPARSPRVPSHAAVRLRVGEGGSVTVEAFSPAEGEAGVPGKAAALGWRIVTRRHDGAAVAEFPLAEARDPDVPVSLQRGGQLAGEIALAPGVASFSVLRGAGEGGGSTFLPIVELLRTSFFFLPREAFLVSGAEAGREQELLLTALANALGSRRKLDAGNALARLRAFAETRISDAFLHCRGAANGKANVLTDLETARLWLATLDGGR